MEILRTDGGGHLNNPPRLIAVIGMAMQKIPPTEYIWENIDLIEDHKGDLFVSFSFGYYDIDSKQKLINELSMCWQFYGEDKNSVYITVGGLSNG